MKMSFESEDLVAKSAACGVLCWGACALESLADGD